MNQTEETYSLCNYDINVVEMKNTEANGIILMIHGFRQYSGRLMKLANYFYDHGFSIYLLDLPGHGKSSGSPRTYIDSIQTYVNVLNELITIIVNKEYNKNLPLFLWGHSLGGLLTSVLCSSNENVKAGIACAPFFMLKGAIKYLYYIMLFIMLFIKCIFMKPKPNNKLFPHPEICKEYHDDPLVCHGDVCVSSSVQMIKCNRVDRYKDITIPFYLYHGSCDDLADVNGSREKAKHLKNNKSKYVEYEGCNHYLYEEDCKIQQQEDIVQWLNSII